MRISQIRITRLFDIFDHTVPFNLAEGITIIHGPNGFGKTILLRMVDAFFHNNLALLARSPFREFEIEFDNQTKVVIARADSQREGLKESERELEISHFVGGRRTDSSFNFNPHKRQAFIQRLQHMSSSMISGLVPNLRQVGARRWRHRSTGEYLTIEDVLERYGDRLSPIFPKSEPQQPEWLKKFTSSIKTHFIRADRLSEIRTDAEEEEAAERPAVEVFSAELVEKMRTLLAQSAEVSQQLDRSFPQRVVGAGDSAPPRVSILREQLNEIDLFRKQLMEVGLLDKADVAALQLPGDIDRTKRQALAEYVSDTNKKLEVFRDFSSRLHLLVEILNGRFSHKSVEFNREKGFRILSAEGREIPILGLSSGEQHELVMFYQLLFKVEKNSIILFDEPEISLHVSWQKQFMEDLDKVIRLSNMDVLIATHSPQIIGKHWNLAVTLGDDDRPS